jgi:hypothetical protein
MSWLRNRLEEAKANLNLFDNGKSMATIRRARNPVPPAQTMRKPSFIDKARAQVNMRDNGVTSASLDRNYQRQKLGDDQFTRLNNQKQSGQLSQSAYDSEFKKLLGQTQQARNSYDSRSLYQQAVAPAIGSAVGMASKIPANIGSLASGAIQDPLGSAYNATQAINPIKYSIDAINAVSPKDIPNPFDFVRKQVSNLTPKSVQTQLTNKGQQLEQLAINNANSIDRNIANSRFSPQTRPGENSVVTNLSSGVGSLLTSLAVSAATKNPYAAAGTFGLNTGGDQYRGAREAGVDPASALDNAIQTGTREAMLEKMTFDKFIPNLGGNGNPLRKITTNLVTEGLQEAGQSLSSSIGSGTYGDFSPVDAAKQAAIEGLYGAAIGGGTTAISGGTRYVGKNGKQNLKSDVNKVKDTYKSTAPPKQVELSDNELYTLTDYSDTINDLNKQEANGTRRNNVTRLARQIADKAGIDVIKGSPVEIQKRIADFVDGQLAMRSGQAGFISADPNESETVRAAKTVAKLAKGDNSSIAPQVGKTDLETNLEKAGLKPKKAISQTKQSETSLQPNQQTQSSQISQANPSILQTESKGTEYRGQQDQSGRLDSSQSTSQDQEAPDFLRPQPTPQSPTNRTQQIQQGKAKALQTLKKSQANPQVVQDKTVSSSKESSPTNKAIIPPIANSEFTNQESSRPADVFDAVAASKNSKSGKKLVEGLKESSVLTKAAEQAQNSGKELNFIAKKGEGDRYVDIVPVDMKSNRIEAGFVVDGNGNVIGNHIKVDNSGIQVNLGGEMVNMEAIIGNPTLWGNNYKVTENLNRNIDRNAPDKQTALRTKKWLWTNKVKSESNYRSELETEYNKLGERIKTVESTRPKNVSKDQFKEDIFAVLNGDKTNSDIKKAYTPESAKAILDYKKETRTLYDSLLKRVNAERVKFGQPEIQGRKDYITHLSEMNNNMSFVGEVYSSIRNSFVDDGMQKTRDGIPTTIAGKSQDFKPVSAFNKFLQRRTGTESARDPFEAVQAYLEPALYNIHMTESTARARAVESAFRTAGEIQQMQPDQVLKETKELLKPYKNGNQGDLVVGFQEYANTLSKKSNRYDRPWLDNKGTRQVVRGSQSLQRIGGRGTILGNLSSVLAQPLNQVIAISDAGVTNYTKGIAATVGGDKAIENSNFIKARKSRAYAPIRSNTDKVLDAGAMPLQTVEEAAITVVWNSQHAKAKSEGLKGQAAVDKADIETERLVAGRGIADKPEAYRSVLANNLLQYTLEVNAQYKSFTKDLNTQQKATFMVSAMGMNALMSAITGFTPLPDFLKAALDTFGDFLDDEDERSSLEKAVGGVQRGAGEFVGMNPIFSAGANAILSQDMRRSLFGEDSQIGMFEGTAAPVQVVRNTVDAGRNLARGNYTEARNDALRVVPFGNQARKSITGLETINRGYSVDRSGNPTFAAPDSAYGKAQSILFGPSSTSNARNYYDNNGKKITGKADLADINNSTDKRATVSNIQARKASGAEGGEFMGVENREELLNQYRSGAKLSDVQKRIAKTLDEMPQGLSKESQDELVRESGFKTDVSKKYYKDIRNKLKLETAEFERDSMTKTLSKSDEFKRAKDIAKLTIAQDFGSEVYDMYSLALYELESVADDETYKKLVAYDRKLYENDLISTPKFKQNKGVKTKSGRSSGSSKAKKGKFDYTKDLFGSSVTSSSVSKSLRAILDSAMKA